MCSAEELLEFHVRHQVNKQNIFRMAVTVNANTCRVGVNTEQPKCWYIFATAACKSIRGILHAGLASNHL